MSRRRLTFVAIWNLVAVLAILLAAEGTLGWLLRHPTALPHLADGLRHYYLTSDRRIAQFDPDCGQYDEGLSYTLRPGGCRFKNAEFSVELAVNDAGLRDTQEALIGPEIIVVGDSQAMGWGVAQHETFAHFLHEWSERRVLNGGVPSYGTVREMRLLGRLDTRQLAWLVLQYSPNDWAENRFLIETGRLEIMTKDSYDSLVADELDRTRYFPGKYLSRLLPVLIRGPSSPAKPRRDVRAEVKDFVAVLDRVALRHKRARLIVFEIAPAGETDSGFSNALREEIASGRHRPHVESMTIVDLADLLTPEHYFPVDGHLTADGHRIVAERLCESIGCPAIVP